MLKSFNKTFVLFLFTSFLSLVVVSSCNKTSNKNTKNKTLLKNQTTLLEFHYSYDVYINKLASFFDEIKALKFIFNDIQKVDMWIFNLPKKQLASTTNTIPSAAFCLKGQATKYIYLFLNRLFAKNITPVLNKKIKIKGAVGYLNKYYLFDTGNDLCIATTSEMLKYALKKHKIKFSNIIDFKFDLRKTQKVINSLYDSKTKLAKKLSNIKNIETFLSEDFKIQSINIHFFHNKDQLFLVAKILHKDQQNNIVLKPKVHKFRSFKNAFSRFYISKELSRKTGVTSNNNNTVNFLLSQTHNVYLEMFYNKNHKLGFVTSAELSEKPKLNIVQYIRQHMLDNGKFGSCKIIEESQNYYKMQCDGKNKKDFQELGQYINIESGIKNNKFFLIVNADYDFDTEVTFTDHMHMYTEYYSIYKNKALSQKSPSKEKWLNAKRDYKYPLDISFIFGEKQGKYRNSTVTISVELKNIFKLKKENPEIFELLKQAVKSEHYQKQIQNIKSVF